MDTGTEKLQDILQRKSVNGITVPTVNGGVQSLNTVNSKSVSEEIESLLNDRNITCEGVAKLLSGWLDDEKSLPYYLILAKEYPRGRLLEAAYLTKDAYQRGVIRSTKPIYFQAILRKWGLRTKFKDEKVTK